MFDGFLIGIYICGYGFVRFFIEFFREPDSQLGFVLGPLSMGQILCILMMTAGMAILFWRKQASSSPK
jgi:phosphatidylglycerol:prolipoprotein diacylglycerol transferase